MSFIVRMVLWIKCANVLCNENDINYNINWMNKTIKISASTKRVNSLNHTDLWFLLNYKPEFNFFSAITDCTVFHKYDKKEN